LYSRDTTAMDPLSTASSPSWVPFSSVDVDCFGLLYLGLNRARLKRKIGSSAKRLNYIMIVRQTTSFLASLLALPQIIRNPTLPLGIRTATKRAGGFKAGSSDSAGKRRGVKKGGGISSLETWN
jgi:hypothetical protein